MAERHALDRNLQELEGRARAATDWRTHHRNHVGTSLGLAFGAGVAVGLLTVPAASHDDAEVADTIDVDRGDWRPADETPAGPTTASRAASSARAGLSAVSNSVPVSRAKHQATDTVARITDALLAIASAKAIEFVAARIPGFAEEIERQDGRSAREHPRPGV